MRRFSMTVPTVAFSVVMSGATPVTCAVSESAPTDGEFTRTVCSTCSSTSRWTVWKPCSSTFTDTGPGGSAGNV